MKLAQLLVEPRMVTGVAGSVRSCLFGAVEKLESGHPLCRAVQRMTGPDSAPRDLSLTAHARLLDLGSEEGEPGPGLVLGLPSGDGEAQVSGPFTWIAWGLPVPSVNLFLGPVLRRWSTSLREGAGPDEAEKLLSSRDFAESAVKTRVTVGDALTLLSYRIYPGTPITEIQHLMIRRGLSSVPVVGKNLEVLGVVTADDVLPHVLPDAKGAEPFTLRRLAAREVMARSVMCASPEEGLLEASRSMIARGMAQLPVVREGELIGFLERATVLRAFVGAIVSTK